MSKRYPGGILRKTPQTPSQTSAQGIWDMASVTQAVKENTWPIAGVPDPISKSLRFRSSASAYLNRTPASAGNRRTWTWSGWVKRGLISGSATYEIFCGDNGASSFTAIRFVNDVIYVQDYVSGSKNIWWETPAVYRDPSAWYHVVVKYDTTQASSTNSVLVYINGVSQTLSFTAATGAYVQNFDGTVNSTVAHKIGEKASSGYFDGYMTEVYLIDGQALTPSSFGNTNDQTGVWQPIAYTGTYGTNGFYLPFSNTASTTTLGYDFSGNSNNWTTNNISLTSGTTYDSMVDVPTQWIPYNTAGDTGALFRGNYCTLNPLDRNTNLAISNGNLTAIPSSTADYWLCRATMQLPSTGKWYWELTLNNTPYLYNAGIYSANRPLVADVSSTGNEYQVSWGTYTTYIKYQSNGAAFANWGTNTNPTSGDVLMFAVDSDNGTMWVGRNGTWYNTSGTANPATNTDPRFSSIPSGLFAGVNLPNPASGGVSMNFGQQPFSYTPPAGFKTLCTTNLSTPTIGATASTVANKYFDVSLWTGNGTSQSITNSGSMQPDFVWYKGRSTTYNHGLFDSIRGTLQRLSSNLTSAESTTAGSLTAFNSNGFSVGNDAGANQNTDTYVGWQWRASNTTAVTNTAGSITSTVSANTTAGFSIVTYTGSGSAATVGHGLGVAPSMIIIKDRDNGTYDWNVYHASLSSPTTLKLYLNTTDAETNGGTNSGTWNSTAPTSTVFSLGTFLNVNKSGDNFVAYCFAQVAGYSAFGSYTGNGSTDGPFIYTGFRPKYIFIKCSSTAGENSMAYDTSMNPYNASQEWLSPNLAAASNTAGGYYIDFVSNGIKIRQGGPTGNASGRTYIYAAFAESPFKYANAR